jgi:hemoglobin
MAGVDMSAVQVGYFDPVAEGCVVEDAVAGKAASPTPAKPDLDSEAAIDTLVLNFYYKLLNDELMAPLFYEVAQIDVSTHIPKIASYWYKMLLGDKRYKHHTMQVHRDLHAKQPLTGAHHERWLAFFMETVDKNFAGPKADQAKHLALRFSDNLYWQTHSLEHLPHAAGYF